MPAMLAEPWPELRDAVPVILPSGFLTDSLPAWPGSGPWVALRIVGLAATRASRGNIAPLENARAGEGALSTQSSVLAATQRT